MDARKLLRQKKAARKTETVRDNRVNTSQYVASVPKSDRAESKKAGLHSNGKGVVESPDTRGLSPPLPPPEVTVSDVKQNEPQTAEGANPNAQNPSLEEELKNFEADIVDDLLKADQSAGLEEEFADDEDVTAADQEDESKFTQKLENLKSSRVKRKEGHPAAAPSKKPRKSKKEEDDDISDDNWRSRKI
ncbi:hypothetical protein HDU96_010741 [Phlyctochytrium bullatum]|nr:hypothetical protein HDU96_010741 [Phlyctochytrium bullatum]